MNNNDKILFKYLKQIKTEKDYNLLYNSTRRLNIAFILAFLTLNIFPVLLMLEGLSFVEIVNIKILVITMIYIFVILIQYCLVKEMKKAKESIFLNRDLSEEQKKEFLVFSEIEKNKSRLKKIMVVDAGAIDKDKKIKRL